jgi:hypothetical protein
MGMIFPAICPVCASDSGRRVIPESPEVETFRCGACRHSWSELAAPPVVDLEPKAYWPAFMARFRRSSRRPARSRNGDDASR